MTQPIQIKTHKPMAPAMEPPTIASIFTTSSDNSHCPLLQTKPSTQP